MKSFDQSIFCCYEYAPLKNKTVFLKNFKNPNEVSFSLPKTTTRSHKRKAVEELVSVDQETPLGRNDDSENPEVGTSKSPEVRIENLEEIESTLRKKILSNLTKS